jgi:hypothetical protein
MVIRNSAGYMWALESLLSGYRVRPMGRCGSSVGFRIKVRTGRISVRCPLSIEHQSNLKDDRRVSCNGIDTEMVLKVAEIKAR